jgi:hypothetical protein
MDDLAVVVRRLHSDPQFADAVRRDPAGALHPFELDDDALRIVERLLATDAIDAQPSWIIR